jgi:membrane-associated phospholipid phosphatase
VKHNIETKGKDVFIFDTFWTEAFRSLMPWVELFFRVITELGSDYFYVALIAIGFWAVDKRASIMTAFVLIVSVVSNYWLKITFRNPRPLSTNWLPGTHVSNYSLPSGHAQNSTTLWGWLGIKIKTWWMGVLSTVLIVLIGLSRVYIGVHWLGDVLLGWVVGLLLLIVLWRLEEPTQSVLSKYNPIMLYLGLALLGIVAMILTELLSPVTIVGLEDNFGANGGLIIGLGVGLALENRYVNFKISSKHGKKWRMALRIVIGLILVFVIMLGLAPILPTEVYWLRAIRYALGAIVVVFIWPFLFKKLDL